MIFSVKHFKINVTHAFLLYEMSKTKFLEVQTIQKETNVKMCIQKNIL